MLRRVPGAEFLCTICRVSDERRRSRVYDASAGRVPSDATLASFTRFRPIASGICARLLPHHIAAAFRNGQESREADRNPLTDSELLHSAIELGRKKRGIDIQRAVDWEEQRSVRSESPSSRAS